jgi:hypothetical protein
MKQRLQIDDTFADPHNPIFDQIIKHTHYEKKNTPKYTQHRPQIYPHHRPYQNITTPSLAHHMIYETYHHDIKQLLVQTEPQNWNNRHDRRYDTPL